MNQVAFEKIKNILSEAQVPFRLYAHPECRTSEESARVRKEAGMPEAIGAKALLCKVEFKSGPEFVVFVLPGTHTLDKAKLKAGLSGFKQFRFSTKEELWDIAGVVPGCMPPFGGQVFSGVSRLYISSSLCIFPRVAFNAAKLDVSIALTTENYLRVVTPDAVFDFSVPK